MNKLEMTLMALMMLLMAGCASSGGMSSGATMSSDLPEIAPYDEIAVEPMPAFVPAE